jgi:hypothetical protein
MKERGNYETIRKVVRLYIKEIYDDRNGRT